MGTIILGVISGLITYGLIWLVQIISRKITRRKFKAIFGGNLFSADSMHVVYAQFELQPLTDEEGNIPTHPYVKPGEHSPGVGFSIDRPISSCEVRSVKYLSEAMARDVNKTPLLSSDLELIARLNISFVSIGGPSGNLKSRDLLINEANDLLTFGDANFVTRLSGRPLPSIQPGFDYGLILKIYPRQFPERTWLICAGIGEWGSSGAAWYLAYKWREIYKYAKNGPFAIIVRVRDEQDESAEPVIRVRTAAEAERYADSLNGNT